MIQQLENDNTLANIYHHFICDALHERHSPPLLYLKHKLAWRFSLHGTHLYSTADSAVNAAFESMKIARALPAPLRFVCVQREERFFALLIHRIRKLP